MLGIPNMNVPLQIYIDMILFACSMKERVNGHRYRAMDDLQTDFMLMCRNAQTYNMEGSIVSL